MTVGEALTEARAQAGLSVDELSQRTRIRETVIRSIEQDDYDACGGDLYVRGYVRAIAGAVGIDAQPLIREYDMSRAGSASWAQRSAGAPGQPGAQEPPAQVRQDAAQPDSTSLDLPPVPQPEPEATVFDLPPVPVPPDPAPPDHAPPVPAPPVGADPADTRFDLPPVTDDGERTSLDVLLSEDPAATRYDLPPVWEPAPGWPDDSPSPVPASADGDLMAAGYEVSPAEGAAPGDGSSPWPAPPWSTPAPSAAPWPAARAVSGTQEPPSPRHGTRRNRHLPAVAAVAVAVVLAVAGLLIVHMSSGGTASGKLAATSPPRASSSAGASSPATKPAKAKPAATLPATPTLPPVTSLSIASAQAFGPDGLADGDNSQVARFAIARNATQTWTTDWYATPDFGRLKEGTGLLLDLGHVVTITSLRADLSQFKGANLQLKTGNGTAPGDFKTAATVTDTGGVLRMTLPRPATARYLLIWFTLLPPNGHGQFQESISRVLVNGRS